MYDKDMSQETGTRRVTNVQGWLPRTKEAAIASTSSTCDEPLALKKRPTLTEAADTRGMHGPNRERLESASSKTALGSVTPCTPGLGPRHAPKRQQLLRAPFP